MIFWMKLRTDNRAARGVLAGLQKVGSAEVWFIFENAATPKEGAHREGGTRNASKAP